jgi:hypothetical protein
MTPRRACTHAQDRPDLLSGFRSFLPAPAAVPSTTTAQPTLQSQPQATLDDSLANLRLSRDDSSDESRVARASTAPASISVVMPVAGDDDGSSVDLRPSITFAFDLEIDQFSVALECGDHSLSLQAEQLGPSAASNQERRRYAVQLPRGSELRRLMEDPAAGGARTQAKLVVRDRHFGELLQRAIVFTHSDV